MIKLSQRNKLPRMGSLSSLGFCKSETNKVFGESGKIKCYIIRRQWSKMRKYLATEEGTLELIMAVLTASPKHSDHMTSKSSTTKSVTSEATHQSDDEAVEPESAFSWLLLACRCHPPLDIMQQFCAMNPKWVEISRNAANQTALHLASACGAHPDVVAFLTNLNPEHASIRDSKGRTPLHLHCERCCVIGSCDPTGFASDSAGFLGEENLDEEFNPFITAMLAARGRTTGPIPDVLDTLIAAHPEALITKDCEGNTPLEYCVLNGASRYIIEILQEVSAIVKRSY